VCGVGILSSTASAAHVLNFETNMSTRWRPVGQIRIQFSDCKTADVQVLGEPKERWRNFAGPAGAHVSGDVRLSITRSTRFVGSACIWNAFSGKSRISRSPSYQCVWTSARRRSSGRAAITWKNMLHESKRTERNYTPVIPEKFCARVAPSRGSMVAW
jgi:hypothetical protein